MPATKTKTPIPTEEELLKAKEKAARWAKERLEDPKTLIVDVETTGLLKNDPNTEIVSISVINTKGHPVFAALVNPNRPIPLTAQKIHGIDDREVKDCPSWSVYGPLVSNLFEGKHIVCFNAGFDVHLIVHLLNIYEVDVPNFEVSCAMEMYSQFVGEWSKTKSDYKWQRLPKLAHGNAHDSLIDCQSTLLLIKKMAGDFSDEAPADEIDLDF